MQKIELNFEIIINAPVEKVWEKMLGDEGYRIWTMEFNPGGSWYEGSFEEGSKVKFLGPGPDGEIGGMTSEIARNKKHEFFSIKHLGYILNGKEIFDTPEILAWAPAYENYTFEKIDENITKVKVYVEVNTEWLDMMKNAWPKALEKLKEICE